MKIGYKRLLSLALTGTLASGLCMQSSAFSFPSAYWPLQAAWFEATEAQDMDATISTAQKTYELFKDDALCQEICEILEPYCNQAAWCYEIKGDLDNAILWRQRQLTHAQWLNDNVRSYQDTILNVNAQLKHLQRDMEVYALVSDPADVPYYGTTGEPTSGVYYGVVPYGTHVSDSAALIYAHFNDGQSVGYWLDYYSNTDPVVNQALNNGGVVELAWNFEESNSGVQAVLSADSYISEGLAAMGSRNATFLLRIGAEMNCWSSLPDPNTYIQAFRKIATEAKKYSNIAVVFSPNDVSNRTVDYDTYYPGDEYVDWIGVSTYKNGGSLYNSAYTYSNQGYANDAYYCSGIYGDDPLIVLEDLAAFAEAHKKPMMISECGFGYYQKSTGTERNAEALEQFNKFYSYLPMVYPQVKAVFLFDVENDFATSDFHYNIASNSALSSAYHAMVSDGAFLQWGETSGDGYTRLSTVNEKLSTLSLATYASFPGQGTTTCQYYIDGALQYTTSQEPFAYELPVSNLTPGAHTITIKASQGAFNDSIDRTIFVGNDGTVTGSDGLPLDVSSADSWAVSHILNAYQQGLITSRTGSNFKNKITRLQFAELAVNLIEKATGTTLPTGSQSFSDTQDPVASKAVAAGITGGTSESTFSPDSNITREQISVMLKKVVDYVDAAKGTSTLINTSTTLNSAYTDAAQVSSWASDSMALMTNNGLMSGTSATTLSPANNTTIQEAHTLILALYNKLAAN